MKESCLLKEIVRYQKKGTSKGIYSVCSANKYVIEAAMEKSLADNTYVLIESTANQVNQFGGYIGMKPDDFKNFVFSIAKGIGFPLDRIILGGDHLGPYPWRFEKADQAMDKACEMVKQYVMAGFTKIHIDTSMPLGDDLNNGKFDDRLIAERGAFLCKIADKSFDELKKQGLNNKVPVYVIGSEVPTPGGSKSEKSGLEVTKSSDFERAVYYYKDEFYRNKLEKAWENVFAFVVQPGVEFERYKICEYKSVNTKSLRDSLKKYPNLVFEGHSTDYQKKSALRQMVKDGIAILKVGPGLTFAMREALFMLNYIENELFYNRQDANLSSFIDVLDKSMVDNPENWSDYYKGEEEELRIDRKYSLYDRCRYYMAVKEVHDSIGTLIKNLNSIKIPLTIVSQFLPKQYKKIREGSLKNDPESLVKGKITDVLEDYSYAVSG